MLLDDKKTCRFILSSLSGLGSLSDGYFSQHRPQLRQCWPNVISWSKAIFRGRKYSESPNLVGAFFYTIGKVFDVVSFVDLDLVNDAEILDFAIELWKGDEEDVISADRYSASPLLACLSVQEDQVNIFYERSAYDASLLVQTLLARFSAAVSPSPKRNTSMTSDLAELLCRFVKCGLKPVTKVLWFSVDVVPVLSHGLCALLDDTHQTAEHDFAVSCTFEVLAIFLLSSTTIVPNALRAGILRVLATVAAHPEKYKFEERPTGLLSGLQPNLVSKRVASAAVASMIRLGSKSDFDLPRLLQLASPSFREEWARFESVLLEHAVIFELFDRGYAEERGICASVRGLQ